MLSAGASDTLLGIVATGVLSVVAIAIRDHFTLKELMTDVKELVKRKDKDHENFNNRLTQLERDQLAYFRRHR